MSDFSFIFGKIINWFRPPQGVLRAGASQGVGVVGDNNNIYLGSANGGVNHGGENESVKHEDGVKDNVPEKKTHKIFTNDVIDGKDIGLINEYFRGSKRTASAVFEMKQIFNDPRVEVRGGFVLNDEENEEADKMRNKLKGDGRPNDLHVILEGDIQDLNPNSVVLRGKHIDYAGVLALRNLNKCPVVVTANVLVVCKEAVGVVLHKRSKTTETEPEKIHLFGGGYMPEGDFRGQISRKNDGNPKRTAERELDEAACVYAGIKDVPVLLAWDRSDPRIHFVQLNYLFCRIPYKDYLSLVEDFNAKRNENVHDNYSWEGEPVKRSFQELLSDIKSDSQVSPRFAVSGKAHLLLWLALGCPGFNEEKPRIEEARKLFEETMKKEPVF